MTSADKALFARSLPDICDFTTMKGALVHWGEFVCYPSPVMRPDETEVEHVERAFETLSNAADRWYLHYRLDVLDSMVAQLYGQDER